MCTHSMFVWRNMENYLQIIIKYPAICFSAGHLELLNIILEALNSFNVVPEDSGDIQQTIYRGRVNNSASS